MDTSRKRREEVHLGHWGGDVTNRSNDVPGFPAGDMGGAVVLQHERKAFRGTSSRSRVEQ